MFDDAWAQQVREQCDPVFMLAEVGFESQVLYVDADRTLVAGLVWQADPRRFAERYPDSGVVESHGQQWSRVSDIDVSAVVDRAARQLVVSIEGWNLPDIRIELSGLGGRDGARLADLIARILDVRSPRVR